LMPNGLRLGMNDPPLGGAYLGTADSICACTYDDEY
jgi:hypothetical protein